MERDFGFDPTFYLNPKTSFPVTLNNLFDEYPRFTRREVGDMIQRAMSQRPSSKYHYINGMYIKIKVNGPSSLQ